MAELFVDDDADLSLVQDRNVAVLGYDDQAAAQALCLRDSGVDVRIGLAAGAPEWDAAIIDGLRVVTTYEACEEADLIVLAVSTAEDPEVADAVLPNLVVGDVVVLQESAVLAGVVPDGVDVVRIAPWAPGQVVRDEFAQGRGVPVFAAVVVDGSGGAWDIALAYARGVGATRAGVLRTTDEEYVRARSFAESTMLRGAVLPMLRTAVASLVESGVQPEVAYLRCVHGLKVYADELASGVHDADLAGGDERLPVAGDLVRSLMAWERTDESRLH